MLEIVGVSHHGLRVSPLGTSRRAHYRSTAVFYRSTYRATTITKLATAFWTSKRAKVFGMAPYVYIRDRGALSRLLKDYYNCIEFKVQN